MVKGESSVVNAGSTSFPIDPDDTRKVVNPADDLRQPVHEKPYSSVPYEKW
jgi:hypothetical protein